jgi:hypothetical protein
MVQQDNVNVRAIVAFAGALLVVAIAIHVGVGLLYSYFNRETANTAREYPLAAAEETRMPPEPRLQTNPRGDLRALRDQEDELLNGYSWADKSAGVVRIPIERAMQLTLERGLPARKDAQTNNDHKR